MATRMDTKTHVLIIEDNSKHVDQIIAALGTDLYEFGVISKESTDDIVNYKAKHPQSQIVILDLILRVDASEGLNMLQKLWQTDKTAFFVIFSQAAYLGRPDDGQDRGFWSWSGDVRPQSTWLDKEILDDEATLSTNCLKRLTNVVSEYRKNSSPRLPTPQYSQHPIVLTRDMALYSAKLNVDPQQIEIDYLYHSIKLSTDILDSCAKEASFYDKVGLDARFVGIGVYGSCGRLEARTGSDVEFTAFYSEAEVDLDVNRWTTEEIATNFWNRMQKFMLDQGWTVEGTSDFTNQDTGFLETRHIPGDLPDRYLPLIKLESLLKSDTPQIRNRYLQVLTELRPVFNTDLIFQMKSRIFEMVSGNKATVTAFIGEGPLREMTTQFYMDARPKKIYDLKHVKKFVYRVLNVLSLRLWLVGCLELKTSNEQRLEDREKMVEFFENLTTPGIYKTMQFALLCNTNLKDDEIDSSLRTFIRVYAELLLRFHQLEVAKEIRPEDIGECRQLIMDCLKMHSEVIRALEKCQKLDKIRTIDRYKWLLGIADVRADVEGMMSHMTTVSATD